MRWSVFTAQYELNHYIQFALIMPLLNVARSLQASHRLVAALLSTAATPVVACFKIKVPQFSVPITLLLGQ